MTGLRALLVALAVGAAAAPTAGAATFAEPPVPAPGGNHGAPRAQACQPLAVAAGLELQVTARRGLPSCAAARTLAGVAIAGGFRPVLVSDGRWWTRGAGGGDVTTYHHYEITRAGTRHWAVRVRVIAQAAAPSP